MGQGQDDDVVLGEKLRLGRLDDPVGQRQQVRVVVAQTATGGGGRGERTDRHLRMIGEQAQNLTARISGGSGNSYCPSHAVTIHPHA